MSEEETKPTPEEEPTETPETQAEETTAEEQQPVDELTKWREMALRTAAEYDNYRKRCVKDREDFTKYANRSLLEELLPVIDNFEMGMQMAQQDTSSMIYIGMSMVQKQLAMSSDMSLMASRFSSSFLSSSSSLAFNASSSDSRCFVDII